MEIRAGIKVVFIGLLFSCNVFAQDRITELNAYWNVVKENVEAGDVAGYGATFHEDGILVSDRGKVCYSLREALEQWRNGLEKTNKGITKVNLDFRFSERTGDNTTAFERGIFRHNLLDEHGERTERFIHFDALLIKKNGKWQIMLEHQKLPATKEEWMGMAKM
ncbi:YybH family protein [Arenibacter troitsensis]|uniref:DUF4440 domain-containing protein n=1 Tax=Arenibacter troitsensis TaxID=188872 RepID=A0A1X7J2Y2_9FLAO|nr:nuclear transport factor 2 family protein [Arenibacter troitsensis]SMG21618.1 protein of unknown function [Arenibacter troitsensis]